MKAAVITDYGNSEVFRITNVEAPKLKDNQVLVRNYASSINPLECKIRRGELSLRYRHRLPHILGADVAGVVEEVGADVHGLRPGDKVFGMIKLGRGGAYAEYVAMSETDLVKIPDNISFQEAGCTPVAALTALMALKNLGHIGSNKKVLINGAAGGVGTFAVAIAHAFGAQVTAISSAQTKELVTNLGAVRHIDYERDDFTTLDDKFDVVFDVVNTSTYLDVRPILARSGYYIRTAPNSGYWLTRLVTWITPFLPKARLVNVYPHQKSLEFIAEMLANWKIKPVIDKVYTLASVKAAHEHSESGHVHGKLALLIAAD